MQKIKSVSVFLCLFHLVMIPLSAGETEKELWERAKKIHEKALVIDAHAHSMIWLYSTPEHLDLGSKTGKSQVDFPTMKEGGLDALFLSMPLINEIGMENPSKKILDDIILIKNQLSLYPQLAELALSADDVRRIHKDGKRAVLLSIEYSSPLEGHPAMLEAFYKAGVRSWTASPTKIDPIAIPASGASGGEGISDYGRAVVNNMNRLGMIIDITHMSDRLQLDMIEYSLAPVIASHSCIRAVHKKPRNISDEILRTLAEKRGVNMITFDSGHLSADFLEKLGNAYQDSEKEKKILEEKYKGDKNKLGRELKALTERLFPEGVSIELMIDHIEHAVKVAGIDHVGLGSDFGGVTNVAGLEDASGFPLITFHLLKRGYKEEEIKKILGGNLLRLFDEVQRAAEKF